MIHNESNNDTNIPQSCQVMLEAFTYQYINQTQTKNIESNMFYDTARYLSSELKLEDSMIPYHANTTYENVFEQEEKETVQQESNADDKTLCQDTMSWTHDDKNMFEQD